MIKIPYSEKAKYKHYRQRQVNLFKKDSFKTVPLNHTKYNGKKFEAFNVSGTKALAVIGTYKTGKKGVIQSILIPKKDVEEVSGYTRKAPVYKKTTQKVGTYIRKKRKNKGKKKKKR